MDNSSLSVFRTHRDDIVPDQNKWYDSACFVATVKIPFDSIAYVHGPLRRWEGEKILTGFGLGLLSLGPVGYIVAAIVPAGGHSDWAPFIFTTVISSLVIGQFLSHMLQDPIGVIDLHNSEQLEYMREHSIRAREE